MYLAVKQPLKISTLEIDSDLNLGAYALIVSASGTEVTGKLTSDRVSVVSAAITETLLGSDDSVEISTSTAYAKYKTITAPTGTSGTINVYFQIQGGGVGFSCYCRIYVNGVAVGTIRSKSGAGYSPFEEDITIASGDAVQLYIRSSDEGVNAYVKEFRIYGEESLILYGGGRTWVSS